MQQRLPTVWGLCKAMLWHDMADNHGSAKIGLMVADNGTHCTKLLQALGCAAHMMPASSSSSSDAS